MGEHIVDGRFKSDKYAWPPPGFVPLKLSDPMAQDLLWRYAARRRVVDAEFADDLQKCLGNAGLIPPPEGEGERQILKDVVRDRIDQKVTRGGYDFDCEVLEQALQEIVRLEGLINSPVTEDWLLGVRIEAAHQQERWHADHDAGKTDPDWFWLVGYLAGKALFSAMQGNVDKAKHHTISTGAALLNWWRHISGDATGMRPGIETPKEAA